MPLTLAAAPLDEVVIGKVFEPVQLSVGHIGRFWELIRDVYPTCVNQPPVQDPPPTGGVQQFQIFFGNPATVTPRVWFVSADEARLFQFQYDRVYANWRQAPDQSRSYVRFEALLAEFEKYSAVADSFFAAELSAQMRPVRLEISYINLLKQGRDWTTSADLNSVLKFAQGFDALKSFGALGQNFARCDVTLADNLGELFVAAGSAPDINGVPTVRFELGIRCQIDSLGSRSEHDWYRAAHEKIIEAFLATTTSAAQNNIWRAQ
ncbi:sporadTIGR04255: family protein [Xylophilus ampelinus]|nr:TIGR04255 family protein [Variovorax sp.]VTY37142.1 sporadTIGR04255: family protein [Xylophilus ampelinus]|tara:strand:- start:636 stop:1427 length:792 start_codon:yes stop_codon:yes gene_type:complete